MTQKIFRIFVCTVALFCLLCSTMTVFAETESVTYEFNIDPELPPTQESTVPDETQEETEEQTEEETTQKTTKPQTTKAENKPQQNSNTGGNANNNTQTNNRPATAETTKEETTEEPLPEGAFYVYLELNNGQKRLKTVMDKPGFVPEPAEPTREGYAFDGWYSDSKFENEWNFYTSKADKEMTIYAKWVANENTVVYNIIIEDTQGGTLEVNPQKASYGEPVVITATPDEGKRLVHGSVLVNGEPTDFLSFVMPKGDVTISAAFEDIPENDDAVEKNTRLPLYIGIGVVVVVILAVAIIIAKKNSDFNGDLDPDEDVFTEDTETDENWIDESITVEDGFKEGKKVVENAEPDFGAPDLDDDE
ncbi:MAG: InlB B-repeat-containing protein [Acutalibacteraceae bacterium]